MNSLPLSHESMLITFNKKLSNLFKSSLMFQNEQIDTSFKNLIRKTVVSEILYNRYVIAISGLQGVGKSTLLKMMYDIPEGYIPEILGIGEQKKSN
jgi:ABC-type phosphate/phosphonate transport system ATPase subunit